MESAAALRPFKNSVGSMSHMHILFKGPGMIPVHSTTRQISRNPYIQSLAVAGKFVYSPTSRKETFVSCVKTSGTAVTAKSDALSESTQKGLPEQNTLRRATFPSGLEALVLEVCDETQVAEVKLKIGDFEMHMKRNIGSAMAPPTVASPKTPPPIPTEPMIESASVSPLPSPPPKSTSEKISPFTNVSLVKSSKLASLETSGSNAYVLVSSPTVGSFRRGRTLKGKRQPPICKEGNVIKEGQVIGFLDQFGTELPVKSDVAGEVLKILFDDGEAVGFGDPLIAVLPSFHGIK